MIQDFINSILDFMRAHEAWAAPIAFLVAFGESLCFASIVWPGWAILVGFSGALAASGVAPSVLAPMVIAAGFGGTLGYALSYWIGQYFKDRIANIWPFSRNPELIPRGEVFFDHYGAWSVFLGHFVGPVRAVIPVVAGMLNMRQWPFQIANSTSAFIWAAWAVLAPFWSIYYKDTIFDFIAAHQHAAATGMFLLSLVHALPIPLLFWPTAILLFAGSLLYLLAQGDYVMLLFAGIAGSFLGDWLAFSEGRARQHIRHTIWPLNLFPDGIPGAEAMIAKWGAWSLVASKFLGIKRAYVPMVAGSLDMSEAKFVAASLVSAILFTAIVLAPYRVLHVLFGW